MECRYPDFPCLTLCSTQAGFAPDCRSSHLEQRYSAFYIFVLAASCMAAHTSELKSIQSTDSPAQPSLTGMQGWVQGYRRHIVCAFRSMHPSLCTRQTQLLCRRVPTANVLPYSNTGCLHAACHKHKNIKHTAYPALPG